MILDLAVGQEDGEELRKGNLTKFNSVKAELTVSSSYAEYKRATSELPVETNANLFFHLINNQDWGERIVFFLPG